MEGFIFVIFMLLSSATLFMPFELHDEVIPSSVAQNQICIAKYFDQFHANKCNYYFE